MSYDLMIFRPESAPGTRTEFMTWYQDQIAWKEDHGYHNPSVAAPALQEWFMAITKTFPALTRPSAPDDDAFMTDYCIGREMIYACFTWPVAEQAYEAARRLAEQYKVGFFDVSADGGDILFPDDNGKLQPIDKPGNLSSIQQIKASVGPEEQGKSVEEILFERVTRQLGG